MKQVNQTFVENQYRQLPPRQASIRYRFGVCVALHRSKIYARSLIFFNSSSLFMDIPAGNQININIVAFLVISSKRRKKIVTFV